MTEIISQIIYTKKIKSNSIQIKTSFISSGTNTLNTKLVVGDKVWAETAQTDTYHEGFTIFSGNIINVDY